MVSIFKAKGFAMTIARRQLIDADTTPYSTSFVVAYDVRFCVALMIMMDETIRIAETGLKKSYRF